MLSRKIRLYLKTTSPASHTLAANPVWLQIAGKFIGPYLTNSTAAFYQHYPLPASFPRPEVPPSDPTETEDCLFLDVLVPEPIFSRRHAGKNNPVLVWIHGGGFAGGYKTQYSPTAFLKQSYSSSANGIVFVALNYRVSTLEYAPLHTDDNKQAWRLRLARWGRRRRQCGTARSATRSQVGTRSHRELWWGPEAGHRHGRVCWSRVHHVSSRLRR